MKTILFAICMAWPCIIFSQYTYDKLQVNLQPTQDELKSFTYANLRLYPVSAKDNFKKEFKDVGKYMSLQEALAKKKVKITEKSNGSEVNTLTIENISGDTIIVIPGQVIKGGKQDRIINQDMVLKPKSGKKDLSVFCVESGRWEPRSGSRTGSSYAFNEGYSYGSMDLRKTVEKTKTQGKVWEKVEEINKKNATETDTKTYTAITNSQDFTKKQNAYLQFFKDKFNAQADIIGVIVVSGDKVVGCDMFATNEIFRQNYVSLLHSYIAEAIINGKPVTISSEKVKAYSDKLLSNEKQQDATLKEKGNSFTEKGKKLRVSSYE
jgi:hypothetical protein